MRLPVDNRSIVLVIARSFWLIELAVNIAAEFELITVILVSSTINSLRVKIFRFTQIRWGHLSCVASFNIGISENYFNSCFFKTLTLQAFFKALLSV